MVDADLDKSELILVRLVEAMELPSDRGLQTVTEVLELARNSGLRSRNIEEAQSSAFLAIATVKRCLERDGICPTEYWDDAIRLTRMWRTLLTPSQ